MADRRIPAQPPHTEFVSRLISLPRGIARLEKLGEEKEFPKDYELVQAGQKVKYCYIVKYGRVIGYEYTLNGEERIYNVNEANSLMLEANLLFDYVCPVNFKTILPSKLVCIDKATLLKAVHNDNEVCMDIMESMSIKLMSSMNQVRHANFYNASWKICDLLIQFADRYGVYYDGKILIQEKISQQYISNLLGINRVTTVRAIKELKEMGLIEHINGYYCIRDMEKLKRHQERLLK
ncbi:MAG: Crp/Fnr family transcriptional regulator [Clostridiales bacterium]|nr:Crp/Fnr family transcriptional regulator [Clostridiales bacterium]